MLGHLAISDTLDVSQCNDLWSELSELDKYSKISLPSGSIQAHTTFSAMTALNLDSHLGFHVLCRRLTSRFRSVSSVLGILKKILSSALSIIHLLDGWLTTKLLTKCNLGADKVCNSRSCIYCLPMYATPLRRQNSGQIW
jgi:hypothetical protein